MTLRCIDTSGWQPKINANKGECALLDVVLGGGE
jgi:hypothetical protein